ncbi:gamma-butyrobetaine hydroxylase-like domain-containing protein [Hyphobacterium sp. HN65]|uniref:Gamma-butyrobetaine hydroxylase-like domain-containing protein n=1 Tax=Hyphobacterium lacteum TaxID=3116575 RepID=A0ABU7LT22_9PROT|nr:gamma-butyrobetaine hydroxylase-like domain-containing protein [Hyphobacterium sp. HN65]MEE2526484.1 gamma-butyrobetaine hydroxylase-like domain-containing protein [Hyphobacterium sp. HN65]
MTNAWPTKLDFSRSRKVLTMTFDDGQTGEVSYELLRTESPSAEVQGHAPEQKQIVTGKENVGVVAANPVGRYAVQIVFDDGHDSGLFTWDYLRALAGLN